MKFINRLMHYRLDIHIFDVVYSQWRMILLPSITSRDSPITPVTTLGSPAIDRATTSRPRIVVFFAGLFIPQRSHATLVTAKLI